MFDANPWSRSQGFAPLSNLDMVERRQPGLVVKSRPENPETHPHKGWPWRGNSLEFHLLRSDLSQILQEIGLAVRTLLRTHGGRRVSLDHFRMMETLTQSHINVLFSDIVSRIYKTAIPLSRDSGLRGVRPYGRGRFQGFFRFPDLAL